MLMGKRILRWNYMYCIILINNVDILIYQNACNLDINMLTFVSLYTKIINFAFVTNMHKSIDVLIECRCWSRIRSGGPTRGTMENCGTWTTTEQTWSRLWVVWRASWNTLSSKALISPLGRVSSGESTLRLRMLVGHFWEMSLILLRAQTLKEKVLQLLSVYFPCNCFFKL